MAANGQSEAGGAHPPPSGGKKKNPFKEGRTMALSELLEGMPMTAGNWSEVVESTATVDSSDPKGGRVKPRADLPDAPRTARGEVEVDVSKVPQEPPFLAFVGNLSYNVTERDLRSFFGADSVNDVNFVLDRNTGRPRGFAYIEFHTRDDLICALGKSGSQLMNRDVKVDIQTGGSGGGSSDRRGNQNRQSSDIRSQQHQSSAYQPARTQQSYGPAQQDYQDGAAGQARYRQDSHSSQGPPPDPDHGGHQYQGYSAPATGYRHDQQAQQSYGHRGEHVNRQTSYGGHGGAYNNSQSYRSNYQDASHQNYDQGYQQPHEYNNYSDKRGGNYDNHQQQNAYYERRSTSYPHGYSENNRENYQQQPAQPQYQQQRSVGEYRGQQSRGRGYDRSDSSYRQDYQPAQGRNYERASLPPQPAAESTDAAAAQKAERKKLDLQPRTKSTDVPPEAVEPPLEHKRSTSIFGSAKPVDTAAKEKEIEERLRRDRETHHKKDTEGPAPLQENADPSAAPVVAARRRTSERTISQSSVEATADAPRLAPQKILQRPRPPPESVPEAPLTEANEDAAPSNKPPLGGFKGGRNVRTFTRGGSTSTRYQGRDSQERTLQRSESERSNHGFAHRPGGQRAPRGAARGGAHSGKPPRNERPPRLQGQQPRQPAAGSPKAQAAGADPDGWINKGKGPAADANHEGKRPERQRSQTPTKRRNSQPKELPKLVDDKPVSYANKNKFALLGEDVDE